MVNLKRGVCEWSTVMSPFNCSAIPSPWRHDQGDDHLDTCGITPPFYTRGRSFEEFLTPRSRAGLPRPQPHGAPAALCAASYRREMKGPDGQVWDRARRSIILGFAWLDGLMSESQEFEPDSTPSPFDRRIIRR